MGTWQRKVAVELVDTVAAVVEVGSADVAVGGTGRIAAVDLVVEVLDVACLIVDSIPVGFDAVVTVAQMPGQLPQKTALLGEVVVRSVGGRLPKKPIGGSAGFAGAGNVAGVLVASEVCEQSWAEEPQMGWLLVLLRGPWPALT